MRGMGIVVLRCRYLHPQPGQLPAWEWNTNKMNVPHCNNLTVHLVPRILNNWLKGNSQDPSHTVFIKVYEEAHIEAASVTTNDATGLLAIVLRGEATDCILVEGVNEFLNPFFELLFGGWEVIRSVMAGLGIDRVVVDGVLLLEEKKAPKRRHVEQE